MEVAPMVTVPITRLMGNLFVLHGKTQRCGIAKRAAGTNYGLVAKIRWILSKVMASER